MNIVNKITNRIKKNRIINIYYNLFNRWKSLQQLMFFFSALIIIISMVFMSVYNIIYIKNILNTNFEKWSKEVTINFQNDCLNGLIIEDSRLLKKSIEDVFHENTIVYAAIYNKKGNLIIENSIYNDIYYKEQMQFKKEMSISNEKFADNNVLEIKTSVDNNRIYYGYLVLLFSKNQINNEIVKVTVINIFSALIFLFFGVIIAYFIAKSIAKPIKIITLHMEELAKGNYKKKIPNDLFKRSDEIITLAKSIEIMQDRTNTFLKQKNMIEKEKLTSLGQLVNGVAHEVNTPVGVNITSITFLNQKTEEVLNKLLNSNAIKKSEFTQYLQSSKELGNIIYDNLNIIAELIATFKRVAVDQTVEEKRNFNVKLYIDQILVSINQIEKNEKVKITIDCDDKLEISSYPGVIYKIVSNFIINSFRHAFEEFNNANINIKIEKNKNEIFLIYRDNGRGIPDEYISKVFDPFFTTNRSENIGLGLFLVYNIVTHLLKGTIECKSIENNGTEFKIIFNV